jgi:hypothetical protein
LRLSIDAPLDFGALHTLEHLSKCSMTCTKSNIRNKDMTGTLLRRDIPEDDEIYREGVVEWEDTGVR